MSFFKIVLATIVGLVLFSAIALLISFGVIGGLVAEEEVNVEDNSVLHLKFNLPIDELEKEDPFEGISPVGSTGGAMGVFKLRDVILEAKDDDKIKGIYLDTQYLSAGYAHLEEIREALLDFKTSGKFVIAYAEYFSEGAYYLASVADQVFMHPEGNLDFNGLDAEVMFFKGLLDKLEVKPQVFKVGDFKSAVEPFIREEMSDENRLQLASILNSIYDNVIENTAKARSISSDKLREISDKMEVRNPQDAMELKLIDGLYYFDQVISEIKAELALADDEKINFISYKKYKKTVSTYKKSDNKIAIIVASGQIVPGEGEDGMVGSDKYAKLIRKARRDEDIKAIVIRVNSPGGSFVASDVMWREIQLARESKPVIASMGNVAASGGYYMAMGCDTIVAQPNTITGSIGIFAILYNTSDFLRNKMGITNDIVKTGDFSNLYTITRPLNEEEKQIIQNDINEGYETFTGKAAAGRGMHIDSLKKVASGRVWSGTQAYENGLVDVLGDFDDAVLLAAEKAGVEDDYKLRFYPKSKPFIQKILSDFEEQSKLKALKTGLGDYYPYLEKANNLKYLEGIQARMPYELEIK